MRIYSDNDTTLDKALLAEGYVYQAWCFLKHVLGFVININFKVYKMYCSMEIGSTFSNPEFPKINCLWGLFSFFLSMTSIIVLLNPL